MDLFSIVVGFLAALVAGSSWAILTLRKATAAYRRAIDLNNETFQMLDTTPSSGVDKE